METNNRMGMLACLCQYGQEPGPISHSCAVDILGENPLGSPGIVFSVGYRLLKKWPAICTSYVRGADDEVPIAVLPHIRYSRVSHRSVVARTVGSSIPAFERRRLLSLVALLRF